MRSYNEALANAKLSMSYAISRTGLRILRAVINSCVIKLVDRKRSSFILRPSKLTNLEDSDAALAKQTYRNQFQDLLKEIDILTVSIEQTTIGEDHATIATNVTVTDTHNSTEAFLPPSPQMPRKNSMANKLFMKEHSQALFLRNNSSLKIDQFEPYSATGDESTGEDERGCLCNIM